MKKVGDKLYCKKSYSCYCKPGDVFTIVNIDEDSYSVSNDCLVENHKLPFLVFLLDTTEYYYVYNYFETKIDRAKRLLKNYDKTR